MNLNKKIWLALMVVSLLVVVFSIFYNSLFRSAVVVAPPVVKEVVNKDVVYNNYDYGFKINLLNSWSNYAVSTSTSNGGILVTIRNQEKYKGDGTYMDIPVLVYTKDYFNDPKNIDINYGFAAPIPPTVRAENGQYIMVTAPRYNFSYLEGFQDVETMLLTLSVNN